MSILQRLSHDERGITLIGAGFGLLAFMSATMLAVDVGMIMVARTQAQSASDAGALAGAVALAFDDFEDRSAGGPAVQSAIAAATASANEVMGESASVTAPDVTFPAVDRVRVRVQRTGGRSNPLLPFIAPMFGIDTIDLGADATAQAAPANAMTCVKPFTVPDKWVEQQTPPWDPDDTFDAFDKKGQPLANPDIYISPGQSGYTGYNAETDRGTQLILKAGTGFNITPSFYNPLALPDSGGGSDYSWNIANCNTSVMGFGDLLISEPGNMTGPTAQGVRDLIDRDAGAYWDAGTNRVVSDMSPSPRVAIIPVYDPVYYDNGKQNGRNADLKAANYIGFFIEGMQGNNVMGRITPVGGLMQGNGPAPAGAFPKAIILVE